MRSPGAVPAVLALVLAGFALAAAPARADGRVPRPAIAKGQGASCVADTSVMRRRHMELLRHQRAETVRRGIRGNPYSLKDCIACHAVSGADGSPVTAESPRHFCRTCHDYVAVRPDCFDCHASTPPREKTAASGPAIGAVGASRP